jgi:dipeptidyl aminopeptidase/acylaminoacyl peptidase
MSFPPQNPLGYFTPSQPQKRSGSGSKWLVILGVIGGGGLLVLIVCCGVVASFFSTPKASAAARQPFSYADVPLPAFGERGPPEAVDDGVFRQKIPLGTDRDGFYTPPGHGGEMLLFAPPGPHPPKSLPCILITGAGTNLLTGVVLKGQGNLDEYSPYVEAGFAVLVYELDGPLENSEEIPDLQRSFTAFKAAHGGLVNARNALEYALAKMPEVDPARIYAAGHSSAGTHALLFAAHEPRLAGVIAYAPASDVPKWFGSRQLWVMSKLIPGAVDFLTQSSPTTHRERLKCPTFLFHAEDDLTCDIADTRVFADSLTKQGTSTKFVTVPTGDHADAMYDEGIPAAIQWLSERK